MIAVKRSWIRSSAASHEIRSNFESPRAQTRRSGVRIRRLPCTNSGYIAGTFAQVTPLVYGFACEPRIPTIRSSCTVIVRLHVSGQSRGHTLCRSVVVVVMTELCRRRAAVGKSQSVRPGVGHYAVKTRGVGPEDLARD